jgi:hypothetical protein
VERAERATSGIGFAYLARLTRLDWFRVASGVGGLGVGVVRRRVAQGRVLKTRVVDGRLHGLARRVGPALGFRGVLLRGMVLVVEDRVAAHARERHRSDDP